MRITHFGHATCLVELQGRRILIDPGTMGIGWHSLTALDAVLITHGHLDHLDAPALLALLATQPDVALFGDIESVAKLQLGVPVVGGERLDIGGVTVDVVASRHTPVYEAVPQLTHVAYGLNGFELFYPGDSFVIPDAPVDVLLLPVSGPWLKVSDAIDYLRKVNPRVAIPIHDSANASNATTHEMIERFLPNGTQFVVLNRGVATLIGTE